MLLLVDLMDIFRTKLIYGMLLQELMMIKEAGGIVNDIHKFDVNKIDIKASSAAINDKMLKI
jgi:myo-inositol-1(or 4)-monophosphatase